MSTGGAPIGNTNAARAKKWREAIMRALARKTGESVDKGLDQAADKLVALALDGERWAIEHMADRLDGKPPQAIVGDDEADPVRIISKVERVLVRANAHDTDG